MLKDFHLINSNISFGIMEWGNWLMPCRGLWFQEKGRIKGIPNRRRPWPFKPKSGWRPKFTMIFYMGFFLFWKTTFSTLVHMHMLLTCQRFGICKYIYLISENSDQYIKGMKRMLVLYLSNRTFTFNSLDLTTIGPYVLMFQMES